MIVHLTLVSYCATDTELADRIAMLAVQRKEKKLRLFREEMDIPTLLKLRAG